MAALVLQFLLVRKSLVGLDEVFMLSACFSAALASVFMPARLLDMGGGTSLDLLLRKNSALALGLKPCRRKTAWHQIEPSQHKALDSSSHVVAEISVDLR